MNNKLAFLPRTPSGAAKLYVFSIRFLEILIIISAREFVETSLSEPFLKRVLAR
jgi:hypothetical protein